MRKHRKQIHSHRLSTRAYNQVNGTGPVLTKVTVAQLCVPSGLCGELDEIGALLIYYAALSGKSLPTFRDNLSAQSSKGQESKRALTLEDGAERFS
jgi:hypothetical protein